MKEAAYFVLVTICWVSTARSWSTNSALQIYQDGPAGGSCFRGNSTDAECPTGMKFGDSTSQMHKMGTCVYSEKTTAQSCWKDGNITCTRQDTSFVMLKPRVCAGTWLNWGSCDRTCGNGNMYRFRYKYDERAKQRFTLSDVQSRSCNVHSCPTWSEWKGTDGSCDRNCEKLFTKTCQYKGSPVDSQLCQQFDDNGPVKIQEMRACHYNECTIPTTTPSILLMDVGMKDLEATTKQTTTQQPTLLSALVMNVFTKEFFIGCGVGACGVLLILLLIFCCSHCISKKATKSPSFYESELLSKTNYPLSSRSTLNSKDLSLSALRTMNSPNYNPYSVSHSRPRKDTDGSLATMSSSFAGINVDPKAFINRHNQLNPASVRTVSLDSGPRSHMSLPASAAHAREMQYGSDIRRAAKRDAFTHKPASYRERFVSSPYAFASSDDTTPNVTPKVSFNEDPITPRRGRSAFPRSPLISNENMSNRVELYNGETIIFPSHLGRHNDVPNPRGVERKPVHDFIRRPSDPWTASTETKSPTRNPFCSESSDLQKAPSEEANSQSEEHALQGVERL